MKTMSYTICVTNKMCSVIGYYRPNKVSHTEAVCSTFLRSSKQSYYTRGYKNPEDGSDNN
jgi:hypothetical protein